MNVLYNFLLGLVALSGLGVVLTRDPLCQTIGLSFYGILLAILFLVFQAPDVALSQMAVGAVALPLMALLALARVKRSTEERERKESEEKERKAP